MFAESKVFLTTSVRLAWLRQLGMSCCLGALGLFSVSTEARAEGPSATAQSAPLEVDELGEQQTLKFKVSEQKVISALGVRSYSEGTRGIVDVRLTRAGDQFVLVAQRPGTTSLLLILENGEQKHLKIEVTDAEGRMTQSVGPEVVQQDNIRLDFYFVQVNRSDDLQVGLNYPQSLNLGTFQAGFNFLTQHFESATAVIQDQPLLRLDMAQNGGWAKLMRKAAVITENGQMTTFSGGGEVNIQVIGSLSTGIHAIQFGSTIQVLPRYDDKSGRLEIKLKAEVADLTDDRGSGVPGRVTSTLDTVVNLELGQAVVLAGLSSDSRLRSKGGVPVLSQIPILGWLFGTERRQYQAFDNVVFIIPTVVNATSQQAREQIDAALSIYQDYHGQEKLRTELREKWEKP